MRRTILAASLLGFVVGIGCKHVGGKTDCYHHPDNEVLPTGQGAQPYPVIGGPIPNTAVPEKLAFPAEKAPETKDK